MATESPSAEQTAFAKKTVREKNKELYRHSVVSLVGVEFIYALVSSLIVSPLISKILDLSLKVSTSSESITGFKALFTNPVYLLALLLCLIFMCFWAFVEYTLLINGIDRVYHGLPITFASLAKYSFDDCKRALIPKNWPILLASGLLIPFTNLFVSNSFVSKLKIPEFITDAIFENTFYTIGFIIIVVGLIILGLFWMYIFHFFILDDLNFKEASSKSIQLMKSNFFRLFYEPTIRKIVLMVLWFLIGMLFLLVFFLIFTYTSISDRAVFAWSIALNMYFIPVYECFVDFMSNIAYFATLSTIFYLLVRKEPQSAPYAKNRLRSRAFLPVVLIILLLVGIFVVVVSYAAPNDVLDAIIGEDLSITAHRGYSVNVPENTIPAFQAAIDLGIADYAELDVQMTKDGVVVISHDSTLKRTAGIDRRICDMTYAEVQQVQLSSTNEDGETVTGSIPTLDEVLKLCKDQILLNIEIKSVEETPDLEKETIRIIHDNNFQDECVITSSNYDSLKKVKELDPSIPTGYILAMAVGNYYDMPYVDFFSVETVCVSDSMVDSVHDLGKEVHVWTVSNEEDARTMINKGVDNIITNDPITVSNAALKNASDPLFFYNLYLEVTNQEGTVFGSFADHLFGFDSLESDAGGLSEEELAS